jgi:uncharacterized cupin superfamily protein
VAHVTVSAVTEEARVEEKEGGKVAASPGWFVLNLAECGWSTHERAGRWTDFEPPSDEFQQYGIGVHVLEPGQPNGKYHSESVQEDFLVLSGECLLIVEGEERRLKAWDHFHCSPGTHHILVGVGDGPCAILMAGARGEGKQLHYPRSELAARHDASAPHETTEPREAYSDWTGEFERTPPVWPV